MTNAFEKNLPSGYYFVFKDEIKPEEIIALRESVEWKGDTLKRWTDVLRQSLFSVGVRDSDKKLVGVAFLAGNVRHAIMSDLCVNPSHQRKGIGEGIMSELFEAAYGLNVSYIYAELSKTNPFRNKMILSGFKETGDSLFMDVYN